MKRVLCAVLTAVTLIALLLTGTMVFAQSDPKLEVTSVEGTAGEQVTIAVSLKNSPGFGGMAYDVYYDNTVLRLVSYELDLGSGICTDSGMDIYEDRMNFQYASTANITGDGDLVRMVFEILAEGSCTTEIRVIPEEGTTFYYDGRKEIDFTLEPVTGVVTIHAAPCRHSAKTEVAAMEPNCEQPGNHLYYICDDCGMTLKADGVTETTEAAEVIPALGHDMAEATCTAPATCRREGCGYTEGAPLEHTFTEYVSNEDATCVEDGTETATCDRCDETDTRTDVGSREDADHSFPEEFTSDHNATCTADGTKSRTCALCGEKETVTDVGSATGHDYGEWYVTKAATCTADGQEQRDCKNCDHYETRTVAAIGHNFEAVVTAPTCTERGYTTHTCQNCGHSYVDSYVNATGHTYGEWYVTKEATCTADGQEQRDCKNCDHFETRTVAATGHDYKSVVTAPTCTERGYTTHTCANCGHSYVDSYVNALDHDYGEWYVTKEATLEEEGEERRDCSRCDDFQTRVIPMLVHSYNSIVTPPTCTEQGYTTHTCANCGHTYVDTYVPALGHDFVNYVSNGDATCTEDGTKTAVCTRCDETDTVPDRNSATGHSYGNWYVTKEATCTADGQEQRDCKNCDHFETRTVEATGHNYKAVVTAPTCTERGYTTHTCQNCGHNYVDSYVNATGHTYGDWYVTKEATCTADGQEQRDCKNCDHSETRTIAATGHDYETEVTEPTCTERGYTTHTCANCGDSYVDQYVPAAGHVWDDGVVTKEPTEEETGIRLHTCTFCGETKTVEIPTIDHEHSYEAVVTAPTCTEQGYTTYTCRCGDSHVDNYVPATGHTYGDWYVTKEATCTADGQEQRDCKNCDHFETRTVAAIGHDYETEVTEPTCTERGYTTHTCANCGHSYVDSYVNATGHTYGDWNVTKEATCTEDGQEQRDCKNCDHFETRTVAATGHNYAAVVTEPSCTEGGYTTHTCSNCDHSYVDSHVDVLGHEYEDGICIRCGESEIVLGDVNGDGSIDTTDAYYIVLYYNEKMDLSAEQLLAADVNGDGTVDTTDAYYIVLFYNEKIDQFPG